MKQAHVYFNGRLAGTLTKHAHGYTFRYDASYFADPLAGPISLSFPKTQSEYTATALFPFFVGLLTEGENMELQCRLLKIDETDLFTRLIKTAGGDTIGPVTVEEIPS